MRESLSDLKVFVALACALSVVGFSQPSWAQWWGTDPAETLEWDVDLDLHNETAWVTVTDTKTGKETLCEIKLEKHYGGWYYGSGQCGRWIRLTVSADGKTWDLDASAPCWYNKFDWRLHCLTSLYIPPKWAE